MHLSEYVAHDASTLSFAIAVLASAYLTALCITPPNPAPKQGWKTDGIRAVVLTDFGNLVIISPLIVVIVYHAVLAASSPQTLSLICLDGIPNPALFTWTPYTASLVSIVIVLGLLRLGAYSSLGTDFTYELAQPGKLVTSGIYAYVQHPSYTGLMAVWYACLALFWRWDASPGCVVPAAWIDAVPGLRVICAVVPAVAMLLLVVVRVVQEEQMMRETFGKEWEAWHAKTARFIPWVV